MSLSAIDYRLMARALHLAERGLYTAHPNPRVGAVIAQGETIVGEGWHRRTGEAHAEVYALERAGALARGATLYVTLEPCCHFGRTGPCSAALIAAGVARVVVAMEDPFPQVAGGGIAALRSAGIVVEVGLLREQAQTLNRGFQQRVIHGRPWVRCKLGMTLDGRTAAADGTSQWITSAAARADVQHWRARSGALLTGVSTVLADNPALTVRAVEMPQEVEQGALPQPWRVIVDSQLRTPLTAHLLSLPGKIIIFTRNGDLHAQEPLRSAGVEIIVMDSDAQQRIALPEVMAVLAARGVNELLVEAGPTLSGALLQAKLIDEFIFYMAPKLLGSGGRGLLDLPTLRTLSDQVPLQILDMRAVGSDWRITAQPITA